MVVILFSRIKDMLLLLFIPCLCSGQSAPPLLRFSSFLDPSNMVYLRWDHNEQELMTFELQVLTTGWVAFGFSPHGKLPGSDIVMGGIFPNGSIYFSDCHVVDEATLEEDESQDYQLLSLTEDETFTTMLFKRHLRTCDPNDLDITFAVPAEETKYACTFIPLPMVKQKHHIYK
ncbi:putative DBH-like monooxygenase protein 2 [Struthio camelus]|uniref:putative DBH-like monooxygenase protein 2 n=1 Tax=Struthio camelus TaxID=8801 RepID=UPI003603E86A